ncbi:hypothetical protein FHS26_006332 [Rhizobium pisi]|uniref:Uncharacterized protein n=1 Tax=Rhizobium pisi TaxID=574561 RepID=A0A427M9C7_9HYPH|nr:hypothetical protein [Rhizobium pisi]MBB3138554.1 hypothetical protein [Rhizobium pisi]RSB62411.1 hypothetical protein EFD55_29650 [Rhizobium pisi]TCA45468.1 hypothetical protein E0J16_29880 [Rhizobium pisi]
MSAIEILQLLKMPWPGVAALGVWGATEVVKAWLASRRTRLRIGNCEIDAPEPAAALRLLKECGRIAASRPQAQLPAADPHKPSRLP